MQYFDRSFLEGIPVFLYEIIPVKRIQLILLLFLQHVHARYCLDVREAISKDLQLSRLQSSLVKNETLSSCVLTEHKTRETRCTRAVTNAAKKGSKASLAKLTVPLSRTATIRNGKKPAALIGRLDHGL